ncbi:MAG: cation diffusion facilitator family transporter [Candidatus Bipolaricaulia bacterium]
MEGRLGGSEGTWKLGVNLASRVLLLGVKLGAFFYTGFLVLLSEALNSLVDLIVTGSLLLGHRASARAGDSEHPFGHLRMRNIVSLIVAVSFITVTSLQIFREAIPRLLHPVRLEHSEIALYVLGFSFFVNLIPLGLILAGGRREITLKTALYDNISDEITIIASLLGVWAVSRGFYLADPLAAMLVALVIGAGAAVLIRENTEMLLGRSPDARFYGEVKQAVAEIEGVRGVHDMIAEYIGPSAIHLDLDLELTPETTVREADRIVEEVRSRLRRLGVAYCRVRPCAHSGEERDIIAGRYG